ncbi:ribonuclease P protein component [Pseudooceanicola sediminis]|uniref:ribonuclease P protein component n=1 Tax=Pseudooceanicola sediminis TaxID=2211117 RepID=UPI003899FB6D
MARVETVNADTVHGFRRSGVLNIMIKRSDFLLAARAKRHGGAAMLVQARKRQDDEPSADVPDVIRVGFTCSKKVGNAVARNRAKRRLREVARAVLPEMAQPGWDYVLVGRKDATAERPFDQLIADLRTALERLHAGQGDTPRPHRPKGKRK